METVYAGQTLQVQESLLDEQNRPLSFKPGYPKVLLRLKKQTLSSTLAYPAELDGQWKATVTVPDLEVDEPTPLKVLWKGVDKQGNTHRSVDILMLQPSSQPDYGDTILMPDDTEIEFVLDIAPSSEARVDLAVYQGNRLVFQKEVAGEERLNKIDHSEFHIPLTEEGVLPPALSPYLAVVSHREPGQRRTQKSMFNIWSITPQIYSMMNALTGFLDKAKLENVIPSLRYTDTDLLLYLQRGLNLFNTYSPSITSFTGINMQGPLFDCHLICASYYALGAQLLAEGALAFDFSGQAVTLNVDRTPQLEGALSRIEGQLQELIPKTKGLLVKHGVNGGDGSFVLGSPLGLGRVIVTNAPTTNRWLWRPGMQRFT